MTHLNTKAREGSKSRTGWWATAVGVFGIFSPILPGVLNIAQAQFLDTLLGNPFEWAMNLLRYISSFFVYLSGQILDLSIEYFVLNMADQVGKISAIDGLWQTFRDLGNIAFIGVLLYIAILTILNMGNKYNTKRMLVRLVIVALFVNFSLFATKVVIDTSNVVALQFYNAVQVEDCGIDTDCNLSHFFADALNISSINSPAALEDSDVKNFELGLVMMFGAIFNFVAAFAMGAMALLLIIRFVVLILLMIASPLAFIAFALPGADNMGKQWIDKLLSQSFFAPAMLAMVYVTARMAIELQSGIAGGTDLTAIVLEGDGGDKFGALIVFIIIIGLMLGSVIVAKKIGAHGASKTIEWGQKARNWGQATVVGAAGAATRSTVGWAGQAADKRFEKSGFAHTYIGDKVRKGTTQKVADAKFGTKKSAAQVAKEEKARKARQSSYKARKDAKDNIDDANKKADDPNNGMTRAEATNEILKELKGLSTQETLDLGESTLKAIGHLLSESVINAAEKDERFSDRFVQENLKEAYKPLLKDLKERDGKARNILDDEEREEKLEEISRELKAFLGSQSDNQLKQLDFEYLNQPTVINNISAGQFDTALKGRSKQDRDNLIELRVQPLVKEINNGPDAVNRFLREKKKKDIVEYLRFASNETRNNTHVVEHVTKDIYSDLAGTLKSGEIEDLRTAILETATSERPTSDINQRTAEWLAYGTGQTT